MSTNFHLYATRDVTVNKTKKVVQQRIKFLTWQTPTEDTWKIMSSNNRIQAYKDWLSKFRDEEVKPHIQQLDDWIEFCDEEGYIIHSEAY